MKLYSIPHDLNQHLFCCKYYLFSLLIIALENSGDYFWHNCSLAKRQQVSCK